MVRHQISMGSSRLALYLRCTRGWGGYKHSRNLASFFWGEGGGFNLPPSQSFIYRGLYRLLNYQSRA